MSLREWVWLASWAKQHPRAARRIRRLSSGRGFVSFFLVPLVLWGAIFVFVALTAALISGWDKPAGPWYLPVSIVVTVVIMAIFSDQIERLTPPRSSDVVKEMASRLQEVARSLDRAFDDVAELGGTAEALENRNAELEEQNADLLVLAETLSDARTVRAFERRSRREGRRALWWNFAQGGFWFALGIGITLLLQTLTTKR